MSKIFLVILVFFGFQQINAQEFTRRDSLQGSLRPERTCFDVLRYDLNLTIEPEYKTVKGYNDITFKVIEKTQKIQLDLFENMVVDSIIFNEKKLQYKREFDAVFISFLSELPLNSEQKIRFYYNGNPLVAKRAPWDGGFVWKKDSNGNDFVGVAVQGTGASLWYPVKDHQTDEPDRGASVKVAVPNGLMNVSNGKFIGNENLNNGFTRWDWEVKNPINNYNIVINIGDYVNIHEKLDDLDLDYYVLAENEVVARKHFEEVMPMMECFQQKFGTYPFVNDGYKLVETPYLGMEHQSAVAYGNKYTKGYLGNDMTGTGIGLEFDFIIIHETGHEWFGNSITSKDIADMWIHESFTTYSECVYVECQFGYEKAMAYINGQKKLIANQKPVIGQFGVNYKTGNSDMYYKGALMLNTIRHIINDDTKWWAMLKKYAETYRHKIIETKDVVAFFSKESGLNLSPIFDQYLKHKAFPELELKFNEGTIDFRWKTDVENFKMPFECKIGTKSLRYEATNAWQSAPIQLKNPTDFKLDENKFLFTSSVVK
ncbi:MAG TPA: M1 family metallopeptidase [Flavobacterium sp.]|jgi:aminopeptidase N|nr:M1 family metallopeptidase [Flavobacterium sp.]HQX03554.1 M1 family metallopeptidase [Flavobacterium sp.]HRZ32352.1 M1 family metallopeptidase [Flavobacterium sp.]HRZ74981.1 M1 family metallopeptidase [Flavobacterium sp.]